MLISDGKGRGYDAEVDSENRLVVASTILHRLSAAILNGLGFTWVFTGYDYDAADTVFFLRNDDQTKNLIVCGINLYCDTASKVQVHTPANPTVAGTLITGTSLNRANLKSPLSTAYQDETGNTQGTILLNTYIAANAVMDLLRENEAIVLGADQCLGVDIVTAGTMAYGQIIGFFE